MKQRAALLLALALLLSSAALLSGCELDSCIDVGCPSGQICDRGTGMCAAPPTPSCEQVTCPAGQTCDVATGACVARATFCRAPGDTCEGESCTTCAAGLTCDVTTGFCVGACAFASCSKAELCDEATLDCRPIACNQDSQCPESTVCDGDRCKIGCRDGLDCREGEFCDRTSDSVGSCRTRCAEDAACPWGQRCVQEAGRSRCEPEESCALDADCREGEACILAACQRELCARDADCSTAPAEYCELDTGRCLPSLCLPDLFEPNGPGEPLEILPGSYAGLTLCKGEEDWYTLRLDTERLGGQALRVRLFHADNADLDLEVRRGAQVVVRSGSSVSPEELYLTSAQLEDLTLRVFAVRGRDLAYRLVLEGTEPICPEDSAEPNNTPEQATILTPDAPALDVVTCPSDADLFALVPPPGGGALRLELTASGALPNPSDWLTQLVSDSGAPERFGDQEQTARVLELAWVYPGAKLMLRADSFARIPWTVSAVPSAARCEDAAGRSATPQTAQALPNPSPTSRLDSGVLCPNLGAAPPRLETDWIVLSDLPDTHLEVDAQLLLGAGSALGGAPLRGRVALLTGESVSPWRGELTQAGEGEAARLVAAISRLDRPVYLRVDAPDGLPSALRAWPGYSMEVSAALPSSCVEDWSEGAGNDTAATATTLTLEKPLRALLCGANPDMLAVTLLFEGAAPRLMVTAEDGALRYALFEGVDTPAIASGVLPGGSSADLMEGVTLEPGSGTVWLRLVADEDPGARGAAYTATASPR